ncbi:MULTISPECIES: hypothetical protein [Gordonia]|uniref:Secreted protein n=1 Tax=Gordonia jacobaea TaxID=122202 RepID=A0ABR5I765_9ACTN|nr:MULTISPECIES: hypothetical protein [Gordonia]SKX55032.1 Uncharacterised protein [Mycobacteroides abscessus subsp. abscessus]KNA89520.1 hypothetical protein ABW18_20250 [Gordonia jacobaea]OBC05694.1 hypothetical protein A5785_12345 [Gordonia sp. 852002-50395_SCH5434458]OBC14837.1 hypothetical protein A5786_22305 [Gordonia sp. 852002-50816_SCH5313054-a]OBC18420.1 hypothetical protein A5788_09890 [Gordonia sp. 852002-50816_SCH5313054-c]
MTFLLAIVGLAAIGFLLWRAFGPALAERRDTTTGRPTSRSHGPVGPDDDADFLRDLDRRTRGPNDEL